jgi:hypothetical protein
MDTIVPPEEFLSFEQAELAYIAEQLLMRHPNVQAQKEWVAKNLMSTADKDGNDTLARWCTESRDPGQPLDGFIGSDILCTLSEFYDPSYEGSPRTLELNAAYFPCEEEVCRLLLM